MQPEQQTSQRTKLKSLRNIVSYRNNQQVTHVNRRKILNVDRNMSYFDKLKNMIQNSQSVYKRNNTQHKLQSNANNSKPIVKDTSQTKAFKIRQNYKPINKEENHPPEPMTIKVEIENSISINPTIESNKNCKTQIVNYSKFKPLLNSGYTFDKVELRQILGSGAYAHVRLCLYKKFTFAVKVIEKYKLLSQAKKKRVYSEVQLLGNLKPHPNIIELQQAYEDKRQIHLIFQHIDGAITLQQFFRNNRLILDEKILKSIFNRTLKGIYNLHSQGIAHRDIKPDNILIGFDDDGQMIVKIIDFGFSTTHNIAQLQCGTPNFMAPQLTVKKIKYSPFKSDCWALGILLFYLYEGRYPFKGFDEKDLFRNIRLGEFEYKKIHNEQVKELIEKALVVDAQDRASIKDLVSCAWFKN